MTGTIDKIVNISPIVKVNGVELDDDMANAISSLRVDLGLGLVGRTTLRLDDPGYEIAEENKFVLGAKVEVSLSGPPSVKLFSGTITGVKLEQPRDDIATLVVVADDGAYKLTRGTNVRTFTTTKYSDVVSKLAAENGLKASVDASTEQFDYLLQTGTDLEYLNTIVERMGCAWWVEPDDTLHVQKVKVTGPAVTVKFEDTLLDFSVRASGLRPTEVKVSGWDPKAQQNVVGQSSPPSNGNAADLVKPFLGTTPGTKLTDAKASIAETSPITQGEAETVANSVFGDWESAAVVAQGTVHADGAIKPGITIKVDDVGPASGNYLVTAVQHTLDHRGLLTRFTAGSRRPSGLVDTLAPPTPDPGLIIGGLVVGVITDNKGPNGEVKVKYIGVDGEVTSPWARVVTLGGGPQRGVVFQPEVNDEVLVGFERGDTRRPVVIGGLYSDKNKLPTSDDKYVTGGTGLVDYRRITSRKNHILEFGDGGEPTKQHILLLLGTAPHKLRLGADRFDIEIKDAKPVLIKSGEASFEITEAGDINIKANNINIQAQMNVKVEAQVQAQLKGAAQMQVQGGVVQVKADGVGNIEAGGPLAVKGAIVNIN
jgi:phage protein D/phage baseplate assembly protein gpV